MKYLLLRCLFSAANEKTIFQANLPSKKATRPSVGALLGSRTFEFLCEKTSKAEEKLAFILFSCKLDEIVQFVDHLALSPSVVCIISLDESDLQAERF